MLRRISIIDQQFVRHLPRRRIKPMSGIATADAPTPRNHLTAVSILSAQLDHTPHGLTHHP